MTEDQRKEIEEKLKNKRDASIVIMSQEAIAYRVKSKIEVIFYHEIIAVKKKAGKVLLYGKEGVLGTIPETKEYPVDFILQELKNKNPKIKRIRKNAKKKKRMGMLKQFHDRLTYRQQEIFYGVYLLVDLIVFLMMEMFVILIWGDGTYSTNMMVLLIIFVLMASVYMCKKASDKYKTYWLKGVQYVLLMIKVIFCIMGIDAIL